jgi:hypothetical protein
MIWNGILEARIFCTLVVTTLCAGCITGMSDLTTSAQDYADLSDPTADKAQLRAARWDIGIAGVYCYMTAPAYAERVTVNAGTVDVSVVCDTDSIEPGRGSSGQVDRASFSFDALAGHDYVITKRDCSRCVKLTDETTGKMVDKFELSTKQPLRLTPVNPDAALILATPANPWSASYTKSPEIRYAFYGNCMPTRGGFAGRREFIEVDAGPIKIDAICDLPKFFSRRLVISSFNFVGEAGHIYTMSQSVTEKICINLVDITSGALIIACEPYREYE